MALFCYDIFIRLYLAVISIAALWNPKAKEWIRGRKNLIDRLQKNIDPDHRTIWVHCASAGELEQGKPVIEILKQQYPRHRIVISFFSPSGFSMGKKYQGADVITYLPADTRKNAQQFLETVRPELVIFIKYEFWYHHIAAAAYRHIPVLVVSAIFRESQVFFRWYGKFFLQMLFLFRNIFVQDESSLSLLKQKNILHACIAGDTRFDRVLRLIENEERLPRIEEFIGGRKCIVAGSTWKEDEVALRNAFISFAEDSCLIIAPHEINRRHLDDIAALFPGCVFFSDQAAMNDTNQIPRVLVIDNFGMLSRLYKYATLTYIGGGFNASGIHNTLEAAVYGKPVFFGPNYQKFKEARDLIRLAAAFSYTGSEELKEKMGMLLKNAQALKAAGTAAGKYVADNQGATRIISNYIQENRLLTS